MILNIGLKNWILYGATGAGGSLSSAMNGGKLYVFGGPIPASADVAATGATLLAVVSASGGSAGLTFGSVSNGIMSKNVSETWECLAANVVAGTAMFYRFCGPADTPTTAAGTPALCIQGTIGTDSSFDMTVATAALSSAAAFGPVTVFEVAI